MNMTLLSVSVEERKRATVRSARKTLTPSPGFTGDTSIMNCFLETSLL